MADINSILIVGPAWIGDMVMAQALFKRLKQNHPNASIDVLAPEWSKPLLTRMPEVRDAITMPLSHGQLGLRVRYSLGIQLKEKTYSRAIILPRTLKSALVPYFAGIPKRTGYRGEMRYGLINDMRSLNEATQIRMVDRYVALGSKRYLHANAAESEYPRLTIDKDNVQRLLSKHGLNAASPVFGLMPGAEYGPSKQWPVKHFASLATSLAQKGIQVWLLGSNKDRDTADAIIKESNGHGYNLCGKTELADAIDLISLVDVAVCNDSGLMHVASATARPVIAIYGSRSSFVMRARPPSNNSFNRNPLRWSG